MLLLLSLACASMPSQPLPAVSGGATTGGDAGEAATDDGATGAGATDSQPPEMPWRAEQGPRATAPSTGTAADPC